MTWIYNDTGRHEESNRLYVELLKDLDEESEPEFAIQLYADYGGFLLDAPLPQHITNQQIDFLNKGLQLAILHRHKLRRWLAVVTLRYLAAKDTKGILPFRSTTRC